MRHFEDSDYDRVERLQENNRRGNILPGKVTREELQEHLLSAGGFKLSTVNSFIAFVFGDKP